MYASSRIYKADSIEEVARMVNEDFVPMIERMPGFSSYFCVAADDGTWATVSIFDTDPHGRIQPPGSRIRPHSEMINLVRRVEMITGEVIVHCHH